MTLMSGRSAIVTGGASGIGLAVAQRLLAEGASVTLADADADRLDQVTAELQISVGGRIVGTVLDVRDESATRAAVATSVDTFGRLDAVVNCAGVTRDGLLENLTLKDWHLVLDVSLTGSMLMTQAASEVMRDGGGAIVNMSSISGKVGMFGQTNYSSAKAGLVGLTKASAKELARHGVRVNVVQPGLIETPMTADLPSHIRDKKIAEVPLGRIGTATEVAEVVLFLCSDMSAYMTGGVLEVAGGRFM